MSTIELKKKLIRSIRKSDNSHILEEVFRLLEIENEDIGVYKLTKEQKIAMDKARNEIKRGEYLTDEQADKEIDEWLKK